MSFVSGLHRHQMYLPTTLDEVVNADNPVRIIDALVASLDLKKLGFTNVEPPTVGRPSYAATDLLKLYLYGYENGIRSSRKLERENARNLELHWLLRGLRPDHKTIAEFRRKNPKPFQQVFRRFVAMADGWGLLGKEVFAIDGSKIKASNNKKQNFSKKKLVERLARIDVKIADYLALLDENDESEAAKPTVDVQETIALLQERKALFEGCLEELEQTGETELSLVDKDARLMGNNRNGVEVSYNVQSAVDEKHSLVVEINVTNNPADHGQLSVMSKRIKKRLKLKGFIVLADKGYYNGRDLRRCKKNKITTIVARPKHSKEGVGGQYSHEMFVYNQNDDSYTCPVGSILLRTGTKCRKVYQNKKACGVCPRKAECISVAYKRLTVSHDQAIYDETDQRTRENQELYKRRQMMVEHPFGTIKHSMNARYFLLRTLKKVRGESALLFLVYNLKRVQNILGFDGLMARLAI